MAATFEKSHLTRESPVTQSITCKTLQANVGVDIALLGPSGAEPDEVAMQVTTPPNDKSAVYLSWDKTLNDTTNDTITVEFQSTGALAGAEVELLIKWNAAASGGIG